MYGLVNKAIQDLVTNKFGIEKWIEIKNKSGFEDDLFIGLQSYPDELTYKIVGNASEVLGLEAESILEAFGEYWILYTAEEGYGGMIDLAGTNLVDFLKNLDMLHIHVTHLMPGLVAPHFTIRNETANSVELEYRSERNGLSPMVRGLLKGLGVKFNQECQIEQIAVKGESSDCDVFKIEW